MGTVGLDVQGAFEIFHQYGDGIELTCDTGSAGSTLIWIINGMLRDHSQTIAKPGLNRFTVVVCSG